MYSRHGRHDRHGSHYRHGIRDLVSHCRVGSNLTSQVPIANERHSEGSLACAQPMEQAGLPAPSDFTASAPSALRFSDLVGPARAPVVLRPSPTTPRQSCGRIDRFHSCSNRPITRTVAISLDPRAFLPAYKFSLTFRRTCSSFFFFVCVTKRRREADLVLLFSVPSSIRRRASSSPDDITSRHRHFPLSARARLPSVAPSLSLDLLLLDGFRDVERAHRSEKNGGHQRVPPQPPSRPDGGLDEGQGPGPPGPGGYGKSQDFSSRLVSVPARPSRVAPARKIGISDILVSFLVRFFQGRRKPEQSRQWGRWQRCQRPQRRRKRGGPQAAPERGRHRDAVRLRRTAS